MVLTLGHTRQCVYLPGGELEAPRAFALKVSRLSWYTGAISLSLAFTDVREGGGKCNSVNF